MATEQNLRLIYETGDGDSSWWLVVLSLYGNRMKFVVGHKYCTGAEYYAS